jgi:hypothetical protein
MQLMTRVLAGISTVIVAGALPVVHGEHERQPPPRRRR